MRQDAKADIGELAQPLYTTTSRSQREWRYRKDRVRGRNVWDSQFLDTIVTVVTLAIVDLFFSEQSDSLRMHIWHFEHLIPATQGGSKKADIKRDPDGVDQLTSTSYPATRSADAATSSPPQTPHCHRRTDTRREVKRTKQDSLRSGSSSFSSSASSLAVSFSFTSPSLGSEASQLTAGILKNDESGTICYLADRRSRRACFDYSKLWKGSCMILRGGERVR